MKSRKGEYETQYLCIDESQYLWVRIDEIQESDSKKLAQVGIWGLLQAP